MLVVGTGESDEVSPADVGVGKEGLLLSRIVQNGTAAVVCVCARACVRTRACREGLG